MWNTWDVRTSLSVVAEMEGTLKVTIMYEGTVEAAESNKSIFPAGGYNLKGTQSPSEDCICPCQARRCVCWAPSCALSHPPSIHTHTSFDTTVLVNTPVCLHTVCCHRSAAGAKLEDRLTCQKILPHPTHNMGHIRLYLCIHHTADRMTILISELNLLFHWDCTDPEKPDSKAMQSCTQPTIFTTGEMGLWVGRRLGS